MARFFATVIALVAFTHASFAEYPKGRTVSVGTSSAFGGISLAKNVERIVCFRDGDYLNIEVSGKVPSTGGFWASYHRSETRANKSDTRSPALSVTMFEGHSDFGADVINLRVQTISVKWPDRTSDKIYVTDAFGTWLVDVSEPRNK